MRLGRVLPGTGVPAEDRGLPPGWSSQGTSVREDPKEDIIPPPLRELAAGTSALLRYAPLSSPDLLQSGCFGSAALVYIWSGLAFAFQIRWEGLTLCFWGFGDFFSLARPLSYFSMISPPGSG